MKRHFERQADYCTAFGAELTARLLRLLPDCISAGSALGQRIAHWPGDQRQAIFRFDLPAVCMPISGPINPKGAHSPTRPSH
jgi:hypothetical protein